MGYLFSFNEKLTSPNMEAIGNPNKKLRLDLPNNFGNLGNDDLWGQSDLTADEFDLLEIQATQPHNIASSNLNSTQCPEIHKSIDSRTHEKELESVKLQQYELEGRVKLLSQSLEKTSKELQNERLNRDKIVAEKIEECHRKEKALRNEIEKMQSILQFKEQEMKSVYDKIHVLQSHPVEKKDNRPEMANKISPNKFLERFEFEKIPHKTRNAKNPRKYKLQLDIPRGDTQGIDIVSSILCNKLNLTQNPYVTPTISNYCSDSFGCKNVSLSTISLVRLKSEQEMEDLFEYYESILKTHISQLQSCDPKSKLTNCGKMSPLSLRKAELGQRKVTVISCLRDLTYMLSCSQSAFTSQKLSAEFHFDNEEPMLQDTESVVPCSSFFAKEAGTNSFENSAHLLLRTLTILANPDTYPSFYTKNEEMEWSLAAIVAWSYSSPEKLMKYMDEIPVHILISCSHSTSCTLLTLSFLINVSVYKEFASQLIHKNGTCLLCTVANLLFQKVSLFPLEFPSLMIMVEDFLSTIFSIHNSSDVKLESSHCSSEVVCGLVTALWKFCEVMPENDISFRCIVKKGFYLLHMLSNLIQNFKEKRTACEDYYILFVGRILRLSKDYPEFKELHDLIHDLWDFQEDISEFDLDDQPEDISDTTTTVDLDE